MNKTALVVSNTQKYLNWFVFFSIFTAVKIAGISITFYIFLLICYIMIKNNIKLFKVETKLDYVLLFFAFVIFLSALFQEDLDRYRSFLSIVKLPIQYIYWVVLALYIKTWIKYYDYLELSKYILWAILLSTFYYIFLNGIHLVFFPNEFAYDMILSFPLSFYYMEKQFSRKKMFAVVLFLFIGIVWSQSRTGLFLFIVEVFILFYFMMPKLRIASFFFVILIFPLFYLLYAISDINKNDIKEYKYELANTIEHISPKYAYTLRMKEDITQRDKSLLIRILMYQKAEKIFKKHPILGIGIGNFVYYNVDFDMTKESRWLTRGEDRYNKSSSQNSYLMILAESGLLGILTLFIIFISIIYYGIKSIIFDFDKIKLYIFTGFLVLFFYGFILVTIQGSSFWLLLGLSLTLLERNKKLT